MSFTVQDFHDLIRLLQEHPQWREELRRWVLTDEVLSLPAVVRELAERIDVLTQQVMELALAQQRTERQLSTLAEAQRRTEERLDALAEAQRRTEQRLEALILRVDALTEAQAQTQEGMRALAEAQARTENEIRALTEAQRHTTDSLNELRGETLEIKYRERAYAYFSKLIRRAHLLSSEELYGLIDQAIAKGQLTEEEGDDLVLADAIVRGVWREDKQEVYLVVEVSWVVGMNDVDRARRRADLLAKAGVRTVPVVAGKSVLFDAIQGAKAARVWQVRDGVVTPP